jgi:hypothetical protein
MSRIKHHYFNEINGLDQSGNPDPCAEFENDPEYQEWSETIEQENQQHQDESALEGA